MKYIFHLLLFTQIAQAQQSHFREGEMLYVWALSGLNMRKLPDAKSEKIAALPYGTKVTVQSNIGIIVAHEVEEFKDFKVKGVWLLVKYGNKEGFVFDGYMSRLVAPKLNENQEVFCSKNFGKPIKRESGKNKDEDFDAERQIFHYQNQTILDIELNPMGGQNTLLKIPDISLFESYIIFKKLYKEAFQNVILTPTEKGLSYNTVSEEGSVWINIYLKEGFSILRFGYSGS
jgi:Bacterial SH3 domain